MKQSIEAHHIEFVIVRHEVRVLGSSSWRTWNRWKRACLTFNCFRKKKNTTQVASSDDNPSLPFFFWWIDRQMMFGVRWDADRGNDRTNESRTRRKSKAIRFTCECSSRRSPHSFNFNSSLISFWWNRACPALDNSRVNVTMIWFLINFYFVSFAIISPSWSL